MAVPLSPQTKRCWPIFLPEFWGQRTIQFFCAGTCPNPSCSTVESRSRSRPKLAPITITCCSILSPEVWGPANHSIFSRWRLPESELLNGRIAIAVTPEAGANYYHWLLDLLPRVLLLKHATQNFSNYDTLLLNGSRANYERETLTALEVPPEKIRFVDSHDRFQIASAVFPSLDNNVVAPWKVHGLHQLASPVQSNQHRRRLYLSRARAAVRRIANEKEISEALRQHDFEILEAETQSFREQAALFANASAIVAPHGAALANIVFCQPGTRVVGLPTRPG